MSGITTEQIDDLVATTLQDMPLSPLENLLICGSETEEDAGYMAQFIKKYYSQKQIEIALSKFHTHLENVKKLFGLKGTESDGT